MNSVPENRVGVASGINNAISRTAGLFAIAVFGIVMLQSFDRRLDQRLAEIELTSSARDALATQRNKLAGAELPKELHPGTRPVVKRAIEESFVSGFRVVMGLGALLAAGSSVSAAVLIRAESRKA